MPHPRPFDARAARMLSMAAANERLKELNPAIDITREASKRYLDYMFRMTEANKIKKEIKQRIAELREREIDPSRFVRALVTDPRSSATARSSSAS